MKSYTLVLFLLAVLGVYILARIALKWLSTVIALRQICRELITTNMRHDGKAPSDEDVEEILAELELEKEES